jgi:3-methyladenine DNA glycosylase AlkD
LCRCRQLIKQRVRDVLTWLERRGTRRNVDGMARYAVVPKKAFGVSVGNLRALAKRLGRDHELARALWKTEWYEARMLTSMVGEHARISQASTSAGTGQLSLIRLTPDTTCRLYSPRSRPLAWPNSFG